MTIMQCPNCLEDFSMKTKTQRTCSKKECRYQKKLPQAISPIGKRTKERIREYGNENDFFLNEVWNKRPHVCEITGDPIYGDPQPIYFSHNLSKGRYPSFRYNPKNITLVGSEAAHRENDRRNKGRDIELIMQITA